MIGRLQQPTAAGRGRCARAFSIFDLLVSVVVISILMAIMLPVLAHATEASRRVACRSNVRQMALSVAMYSEDHLGLIPESEFASGDTPDTFRPEAMNTLNAGKGFGDWEGLGWLYAEEYLRTPSLFYCPSHRGHHSYSDYEAAWLSSNVAIVGNYHFRALTGPQYLNQLPKSMALIADGMRTTLDYNHQVGSNVARVDMSVEWVPDENGLIAQALPEVESDSEADSEAVARAWFILEDGDDNNFPGLPWRPRPVDNPGSNAGFAMPQPIW
ncbi:MAG: type II secretion system protein [Phycisphaerales bacterium]